MEPKKHQPGFEVGDVIDVSRYLQLSSDFNPQKVKQMGWKVKHKSVIRAASGVKSPSLHWSAKTRDGEASNAEN